MTTLSPVHFDIPWRAIAKGNKQKVAKRGANSWMIKRDFDGSLAQSEKEFAALALARVPDHVIEELPWTCPFKAEAIFFFKFPKRTPKWKREAGTRDPSYDPSDGSVLYYDQAPDLENVEKWLWDSLEGVFYENDKRLVKKVVSKRWGEEDRIRVTLTPLIQSERR